MMLYANIILSYIVYLTLHEYYDILDGIIDYRDKTRDTINKAFCVRGNITSSFLLYSEKPAHYFPHETGVKWSAGRRPIIMSLVQ